LENWEDATDLQRSMESIRKKYKGILEDVLKRVCGRHKELDCPPIHLDYPGEYSLNLGVGKKAWPCWDKKWPSGFWIGDFWLENLTSEDEEHPSANVYIGHEKSDLDLDDAANTLINEARNFLPKKQLDHIERWTRKHEMRVYWPLPESRPELLDMLRNDEARGFIDRIVGHFEVLAQFMPVLERIFEAGKRSRK